MTSHLQKGSFGLSFALSIACTISILFDFRSDGLGSNVFADWEHVHFAKR